MFGDNSTFMAAMHRSLQRGDVLRIKSDPPFESNDYHFFVVLNVEPATEDILLLVSGTSQIQKRLEARLRISDNDEQYVNDTTKVFPSSSYDFFTKQTLFDCNEVHKVKLEIIERKNLLVNGFSLSENDVMALVAKVGNSKLVEPRIKRQLGLNS
jgi:hypothetical protein